MKISAALAIENKDGIRCKTGDIVAVKPAGWKWGTKEIKRYLIVEIDLGDTIKTIEDAQKLTVPQFETGELWWPSDDLLQPKIIKKRRYNMSFLELAAKTQALGTSIDLGKIYDLNIAYQPLEKITIPFSDMIFDKNTNKKLVESNLMVIREVGK
jgi:hypothetical protein